MSKNKNTPQMELLKKTNQENRNQKDQKKYAPYIREKKEKTTEESVVKEKKIIRPDELVFTTGNPVCTSQFKDIKQYKKPEKNLTSTPEMVVVKKLNEKNKQNNKDKIYSAIKNEEKKIEEITIPKIRKEKRTISLTDTPIDHQKFQSIKNYKEPEKIKQKTPEMAKLKKIKKPRKRNLILIKQTRSNPVQRHRPKPRSVVPPSKKIQVL